MSEYVYVLPPCDADWWYEAGTPRGLKVPAALWAEYLGLKAQAAELEARFETFPHADDRVLTAEQREAERQWAGWAMGLIPLKTPIFNAVPRAPRKAEP